MRNSGLIIVAVGVAALSGCGSKMDANEANFSAAIANELAKSPRSCTRSSKSNQI